MYLHTSRSFIKNNPSFQPVSIYAWRKRHAVKREFYETRGPRLTATNYIIVKSSMDILSFRSSWKGPERRVA